VPLPRRSLTVAAVVALTLSGLGVSASADESAPVTRTEGAQPEADQPAQVARGLIVKTTTATPSDSLLDATDDALDSETQVADDDLVIPKVSTVGFDEVVPASVASDAAEEIEKRSDVVWAIPDTLRQASSNPPVTVNDPFFSTQTNLWNTGVTSPSGGYSTKAPSLWRKTTGSSDVTVAVVDTGITQHPDLAGQVVPGYDMISDAETGIDGDGRDDDPSDPGDWVGRGFCGLGQPGESSSWHGTFVAGMIAAQADNAQGIAGIAPGVKIRPVRVLGRCGGWESDILAGITWASGGSVSGVPSPPPAAQVVNLSLGGYAESTAERDDICQAYDAVAAAGRARGSLFVAAAGNDFGNANMSIPAACSKFISVAATSNKGFSSSYSNVGSSVDISAPGGDSLVEGSADRIRSLVNTSATSPGPSFSTALYEGTSMAAPEVSAGAALLYSLGLSTPASVQDALYASVAPFRAPSSTYAAKRVLIDGFYYTMDLNCSGHAWCGRGILDLSKVQTPLGKPTISGTPTIGEPLTAVTGTWVKTPTTFAYQWFRDAAPIDGATGATYYPTREDVGAALSVRMSPTTAAFSTFSTTSEPTVPVPDGPEVTMTGLPSTVTYGVGATATVTVKAGDVPVDGVVELRRGSTVLASQATDGDGTTEIPISGLKWVAGTNVIRAAFVGSESASSDGASVAVSKAVTSSVSRSLPTSVRYTSRATMSVAVNVPRVPNPTGELRVYDGSRRIVTTTLYSSQLGKRTILLPRLSKGYHLIKVTYMGNPLITAKTSAVRGIRSY
jgi:serine protease